MPDNGFNATNMAAWLKQRYAPDYIEQQFTKHPLLAMLKKRTDMGGSSWEQLAVHEDPQGGSASFSTAQTNSTGQYSRGVRFAVTPIEYFQLATVKGQHIRASMGNDNAFKAYVTTAIDGTMRNLTRVLGQNLYRSGFCPLGRIDTPTASTTLTLKKAGDAVNFSVGMRLQASASESADALRDSAEVHAIVGIDYAAGTLVMDGNVTLWSGVTDGDYLFQEGTRQDSASPTRLMAAGLLDWVPTTAPTSTSFFGVDRTASSRLGGTRHDGSASNIEEAIYDASVKCNRLGGEPDYCFMNPVDFGNLVKLLQGKVNYIDVKAGTKGTIGFRAIELFSPAGTISVVPDRDCPVGTAFLLDMSTWWLGSLGSMPDILDHDGKDYLRQASADGIEIRCGYYGNLVCKAPGYNCVITLPA